MFMDSGLAGKASAQERRHPSVLAHPARRGALASAKRVPARTQRIKVRTPVVKRLLLPMRGGIGGPAQLPERMTAISSTRDDRGTRYLPACERSRASEYRAAAAQPASARLHKQALLYRI